MQWPLCRNQGIQHKPRETRQSLTLPTLRTPLGALPSHMAACSAMGPTKKWIFAPEEAAWAHSAHRAFAVKASLSDDASWPGSDLDEEATAAATL